MSRLKYLVALWALAIAFGLTACGNRTEELAEAARKACEGRGGIKSIDFTTGTEEIECHREGKP